MDFFNIHTHNKTQQEDVFSIWNGYPNTVDITIPFSVGIHPWFLEKETLDKDVERVEKALSNNNCFALGECGLDKVTATNFDLQLTAFKKQIALSEKYQKPVIIHCVRAYQEIIEIKKELQPKQNWIIHGFHKNKQLAESLLKNDIYLSFGAKIISDQKLQEVLISLPPEKFFLETDDAKITIQKIYEQVASLKNSSIEELTNKIKQNFTNIFKR